MKDKKALLILIPFLLFVIIIGAFAIVGDRIPDNPPETVGNTAGNLNNSGYFCEYDGNFGAEYQKTWKCLRTKYPGWR